LKSSKQLRVLRSLTILIEKPLNVIVIVAEFVDFVQKTYYRLQCTGYFTAINATLWLFERYTFYQQSS